VSRSLIEKLKVFFEVIILGSNNKPFGLNSALRRRFDASPASPVWKVNA